MKSLKADKSLFSLSFSCSFSFSFFLSIFAPRHILQTYIRTYMNTNIYTYIYTVNTQISMFVVILYFFYFSILHFKSFYSHKSNNGIYMTGLGTLYLFINLFFIPISRIMEYI